ncbi:acetate--CoA ligase family protein [Cytobacillus purgationiresistens]|uniref:Acetyltransferase n=1 Tax=Cytobacillus purgationiresistens TaxID=863449 RepID=A0ABU0AEK4_9BACI|nr:acetate--CoA ligase family protein [Cytobacillus purgationiresistens]MDQ0269683.1 acetyltransferase [Cytobacillus purgationiresistens]
MSQQHLLSPMLSPKSLAIIGASGDKAKISFKPIANLKDVGYEGEVYLVNPKYDEIEGYTCYKDIDSLPSSIDLALISVSASKVKGILDELYKKKVKSVVTFSSGFTEIGEEGAKMEQELTEFSRESGIPICGPNSLGLFNFKERAIVSFSSLKYGQYDPVAFITQSGALGTLTYTMAKENGLGFQYFVSSGNEACVDFFDYVQYFAEQGDIKVIGGYLEGARDFEKMDTAIKACHQTDTPLVLIKVGNSAKGADAASSHTASMAGNANIYHSYLQQNNVVRVGDEEELIDTLAVFNKTSKPINPGGTVIVTQSGGAGILMADQFEVRGIELAELREDTKSALKDSLPAFASIKNPVDITAQVNQNPDQIIDSLNILLNDDQVQSIILYLQMTDEPFKPIISKLSQIAQEANKIFILCWSGIEQQTKDKVIDERNICWLPTPTRAANALANVLGYYRSQEQSSKGTSSSLQKQFDYHPIRGKQNEWESKQLLQSYGVTVPANTIVKSLEDIKSISLKFPLVIKALSSEIAHKSEYGLVKLNIASLEEAENAYCEIIENSNKYFPEKRLDGVLVEEMADRGIEVIIGAVQDELFGPSIMFGLGGVFIEVLKDVTFMPAPLTEKEAMRMIQSIKSYPILEGARSQVKYDIPALADALVKISHFCKTHTDSLEELDINPLIVHKEGGGVTAVDAFIVGKK